ncbi:hypothetical protein P9A06_20580 [Serratia marcescens]|uniref:glycine-rich domain-containing protein n=1 Tax=Serratia marcescens TaxID=615 RepID=UPI00320465FE
MAKNEFLTFGTAANANVLPNADYQALPARSSGFGSGVAKSEQLNKVWRQSSVMTSAMAQYIADSTGNDVLDNGDMAALNDGLSSALSGRLIGVKVFTTSQTYTPTIGTKKVVVEVWGGGGGGGGAAATTSATLAVGCSGGGGAYSKGLILNPTNTTVTVGAGGSGGAAGANKGGDGGKSSFGSIIVCEGGYGGLGGSAQGVGFVTGVTSGGLATTPGSLLNIGGGSATQGFTISTEGLVQSLPGGVALVPVGPTSVGCGGYGAWSKTNYMASAGAQGIRGTVIVWEYA